MIIHVAAVDEEDESDAVSVVFEVEFEDRD